MRFVPALLSLSLGFIACSAAAQEPTTGQECPAEPAALPSGFAAWPSPQPVAAGTDGNAGAMLAVGQAGTVALRPSAEMHYAVAPEKPGAAASHGGILTFDVAHAGTYRIGLSAGAWIDVVRDGAAIASVAHGHGPACSGIRKIVDFPLQPGRYTLQIAGSAEPAVTAMVVRSR